MSKLWPRLRYYVLGILLAGGSLWVLINRLTLSGVERTPVRDDSRASQHGFVAVLTDSASEKPIQMVRIILAPKAEGANELTIDTSITAISNEKGEVDIQNVKPGEYVVLQSPSGIVEPGLNGRTIRWKPNARGYNFSFAGVQVPDSVRVMEGKLIEGPEGSLVLSNSYFEATIWDGKAPHTLGMSTTAQGALLTVRLPRHKGEPLRIHTRPVKTMVGDTGPR